MRNKENKLQFAARMNQVRISKHQVNPFVVTQFLLIFLKKKGNQKVN